MSIKDKLTNRFNLIYPDGFSDVYIDKLVGLIEETKSKIEIEGEKWSEKDIVLITYGDSIVESNKNPLSSLNNFVNKWLGNAISYVHILPFFPYSSDDGFSVIDYLQVNPDLGDWTDVARLKRNYKLMFDLVINHISQYSEWYKNYKKGEAPGKGYFIEADPDEDLSMVVRPRSLPLLTPVSTPEGEKHVWTTFSADQIDLNFSNPELMFEMIRVYLFYLIKGAAMIRLDAIAFLWKEIGTNCLHLPQTHEFVKILRDINDYISPGLILLTETNVPNKENLSYFGDNDEANMVYQFSLPPLLLHSLFTGNAYYLKQWAESIPELPTDCTFFNFTASHDGIGVRPLEGLVPKAEIEKLVDGMKGFGGKVNTKRNSDGSDSPYELNITYFDALKGTTNGEDDMQEKRFICSQTAMMSIMGVPAFYIHSLLATRNFYEGVQQTGMNRTINRRKWQLNEIEDKLLSNSHHSKVLNELIHRIHIRKGQTAFHPSSSQVVLKTSDRVLAIARGNGDLIAIFNMCNHEVSEELEVLSGKSKTDLIQNKGYQFNDEGSILLSAYQSVWLV